MNPLGTKKIITNRLLLRRFVIEDIPGVYANWASDPRVTQYLTWQAHTELEQTQAVIREWIDSYKQPTYFNWAIVCRDNPDEVIGSIGGTLSNNQKDLMQYDIGYVLAKVYWGNGFMTEALRATNRYLLNDVGIHKVVAKHHLDNLASGKVMIKVGMHYEGIERQGGLNNVGQYVDLACYSQLSADL